VFTTVACPFHINTGFLKNPTLSPLTPVLSEELVADRVFDGVIHKDEEVMVPRTLHLLWFFRAILPTSLHDWLVEILGMNSTMQSGSTGRSNLYEELMK